MHDNYSKMETEKTNPRTQQIDLCGTEEMVAMINQEDALVADAVREAVPQIARAVDCMFETLKNGGHVLYVGAGTSGRLGVLDASECMPTFGVGSDMIQACIAGGDTALRFPVEGCEDNAQQGREEIAVHGIGAGDVVIGISASGRAPYVIGAMEEARKQGARTVAVVDNRESRMKAYADVCIEAVTGPEVISGSTRMKAGTAQKMILNMLSTASMIKLGKVYGNLMVDLKASNQKLEDRAERIFCRVTGRSREEARQYLEASGKNSKLAILMCLSGLDRTKSERILEECGGFLRLALEQAKEVGS